MRGSLKIAVFLMFLMYACAPKQASEITLPKSIQGVQEDKIFRELCRSNDNGWMAMRPMKDGKILSEEACFGCMPNIKNHICDMEEYKKSLASGPSQEENSIVEPYGSKLAGANIEERTQVYNIGGGDLIIMNATIIDKKISGKNYIMYSYNNQIPGPLLKVPHRSKIFVNFTNYLDVETTIHWHGLRLDNKNDGVPYLTQEPVQPGESFLYELKFPDEGAYWYHAHVREDAQQEKGLYGSIYVVPSEGYFNRVNGEEFLVLDDILITDEGLEKFDKNSVNYALMGRFGNVMLVNGKTDYTLTIKRGEVIRFFLINTANARPFNFSIQGARLKLIGSDIGKYEKEFFSDSITIAPAERYIAEAYFGESGEYQIYSKNPEKTYVLGKIIVSEGQAKNSFRMNFENLKENPEIQADIARFKRYFDMQPEYQINLSIDFPALEQQHGAFAESGDIEWEDDMGIVNKEATNNTLTWMMIDSKTNRGNMDIQYKFEVGDVRKIRIYNDETSVHPMQHPIHLHGQRFLVLEQDGRKNENLAWKDTVLVPKGSRVDILVDFTNPGKWMMHCHIAEHLQSGMGAVLDVSA